MDNISHAIRETLLKEKTQFKRTNKFRITAFYFVNIIYLFIKTSYLNEEVKGTEPSLQ
jgi:hypothetical protein